MSSNRQLHASCRRLTSKSAGYDCVNNASVCELKGGDPRTDHTRKGTTRTLGWHPRRDCVLTANARRPEAVGWAPSVCAGPLTTSLRGLLVSGPPATRQVVECTKARRLKNRPSADSELPGWQPKEKAAQLPQKRRTLETAWEASVHKKGGALKTPVYKGEGTQEPWRRGATGCSRL